MDTCIECGVELTDDDEFDTCYDCTIAYIDLVVDNIEET